MLETIQGAQMDIEKLGPVIERALQEDVGQGDVTSMWALAPNAIARGRIIAREAGAVAGIEVAQEVFRCVNALIAFTPLLSDGSAAFVEDELAAVVGPATSVFAAERTALNFLERMSGIATLTRHYVDTVKGTGAVILGTRKTAPGLRGIDQWAVRLGGGGTRRARLDDVALIHSGHIAIAGGLTAAVEGVRRLNTGLQVIVEVQTWEQLDEALSLEPDRIMLTGMSTEDLADAVRRTAGRVPLEASGEIALKDVLRVAQTGVDYISVGALIQRARPLHVSLEIDAA